jgi:uncharacterized phage protein (TIGR01671 family)
MKSLLKDRVIKFRLWLPSIGKLTYPLTITDWANGYEEITVSENCVWQQFTGLHDKNGKEIYEGDLIQFDLLDGQIEIGIVRWSEYGFWTTQDAKHHEQLLSDELKSNAYKYSLIGNIYEHKHLLK